MPPASRGIVFRLRFPWPRPQTCPRRYISVQKPRDPRNFPTQARSRRLRPVKDEVAPEAVPNPALETREVKFIGRLVQTFRGLGTSIRSPVQRSLSKRPWLRTMVYSFFITVPITGFMLMHFPLEPLRVLGPSMYPTFNGECRSDRDTNYDPTWVLVQLYNPNAQREKIRGFKEGWLGTYNRGDIVVYHTPHDPNKISVKRVVGVPGDTVVPLNGYAGGQDPVTIQYYQLWVEGDVNDRKKSRDSNHFGPISEALVKGKVIAMWSPWWNIFGARRPNRKQDEWPAKKQGRVAEGVVYEASVNPDKLSYLELFQAERGDAFLRKIRQAPDNMKELFEKDDAFKRTITYLRDRGSKVAKENNDPEMRDRAQTIVNEIEQTFGVDVLDSFKKKRSRTERWTPQAEVDDDRELAAVSLHKEDVKHENELDTQREARERPAQAALKQMVKQTRQLAELKQKEMEDRQREDV